MMCLRRLGIQHTAPGATCTRATELPLPPPPFHTYAWYSEHASPSAARPTPSHPATTRQRTTMSSAATHRLTLPNPYSAENLVSGVAAVILTRTSPQPQACAVAAQRCRPMQAASRSGEVRPHPFVPFLAHLLHTLALRPPVGCKWARLVPCLTEHIYDQQINLIRNNVFSRNLQNTRHLVSYVARLR